MQYKQLFTRTKNILRSPRTEWEKIKTEEFNSQQVLNDFILPMAGLCALSAFLGILFQGLGFEKALVSVIISLGKSFGGVYFSFFVLQEIAKFFGLQRSKTSFMQLAGYSYVVIFVVDIIANLIPELFFFNFLKIYIFYIVWEASEVLFLVEEKKRTGFVISVSFLILLSSLIIERVLLIFMPGAEIIA